MQLLVDNLDLELFWGRLRRADSALLLLDFDGTLSPFVVDPARARPYPGVAELLRNIAGVETDRLVVISGREVASLRHCLGLDPPPELWGCHGWQRCLPGGRAVQRPLPDGVTGLLELAASLVRDAGFARQLERKPVSLALHWRGLEPSVAGRMRELVGGRWRQLTGAGLLQLKEFDGGLELRCLDVDKGSAVERLLEEVEGDTLIAYLGDDLTDEDAFAVLGARGLKVLVRSQLRATGADLWLQPPEELLRFLQQWYAMRRNDG
ncbi:MAG: trehalose-phosphatase [Desulfuromonadales bacterium]|nr:trehalose-phosphatase [Desulfuromonadales bacterium]